VKRKQNTSRKGAGEKYQPHREENLEEVEYWIRKQQTQTQT
jgi:hypothetical protein